MKYFGEYLISKGIISEEVLVEAFIQQSKAQPPPFEIAHQKKLIPPSQILNALKLQHEDKIDFISACKKLNLWSEDIERTIQNETSYNHLPLGQVLVKSGTVDLTTLTKALDEFLSNVNLPPQQTSLTKSTQIETTSEKFTLSGNAIEDPLLLEEFSANLNEEYMESIKEALSQISNSDTSKQVLALQSAIKHFHFVRGLFRSIQMSQLESIIATFEKICIHTLKQLQNGDIRSIETTQSKGHNLLEFLHELRTKMLNPQTIKSELNSKAFLDRIDALQNQFNQMLPGNL